MGSLHFLRPDPAGLRVPTVTEAPPGREAPIMVPGDHAVLGGPIDGPFPPGTALAAFGLGCFWGAEKRFWQVPGVVSMAVGYAGGVTPNPTYPEVCTGMTGHAEVVRVAYDPSRVSYDDLLRIFWESHDPTQGMRQGADVGTQYRSAVFTRGEDQARAAEASRDAYQQELSRSGYGPITTEIQPAGEFYYAEAYHQQYLAKNPMGYCGIGGTGVACQIGTGVKADAG